MTDSNNLTDINFSKYLFDIPHHFIDPKDENNIIYHPFHIFVQNQQQDAFEGCGKWFNLMKQNNPDIYDLFGITTISQIKCIECKVYHNPDIVYEHSLSVPIDNDNIYSIQDAIDLFQINETLDLNCNENGCISKFGQRSFQLFQSSICCI